MSYLAVEPLSLSLETAIARASRELTLEPVWELLASGVVKFPAIQEAFRRACVVGNLGLVQLLVDFGAEVDRKDWLSITALNDACRRGYLDIVRYLVVEKKSDVNLSRPDTGESPLMLACGRGFIEIADVLLSHGADFRARNKERLSVLDRAVLSSKATALIPLLVKAGLTPKEMTLSLRLAHGKTAKVLIEYGANFDGYVGSLLQLGFATETVSSRRFQMICFLAEHGLSLETQDWFALGGRRAKSLRTHVARAYGAEGTMEVLKAEARFRSWERRKDLLETLVNASHTFLGADNEISIPYGPLAEKSAEASTAGVPPSILATVFRDTRMLGHDGHRYLGEYGGMTAMFL